MSEYIPGHPSICRPVHAGGTHAANYLYNIAPKDGTTFGLIARNLPMLALMGHNSAVRFDPHKLPGSDRPRIFPAMLTF